MNLAELTNDEKIKIIIHYRGDYALSFKKWDSKLLDEVKKTAISYESEWNEIVNDSYFRIPFEMRKEWSCEKGWEKAVPNFSMKIPFAYIEFDIVKGNEVKLCYYDHENLKTPSFLFDCRYPYYNEIAAFTVIVPESVLEEELNRIVMDIAKDIEQEREEKKEEERRKQQQLAVLEEITCKTHVESL